MKQNPIRLETKRRKVRWYSLLLLWCLSMSVLAQDRNLRGIVVDAETGEPLPWVSIYVDENRNALSNEDGYFNISIGEKDLARFSYVEYETRFCTLSELKQGRIELKPKTHVLGDVLVRPWEGILLDVCKKLDKEYKRRWWKTRHYFFRTTLSYNQGEMAEAFVEAQSAVNLRNLKFLCGHHGKERGEKILDGDIVDLNFHHQVELGPMVRDVAFWRHLLTPMPERSSIKALTSQYNITGETLRGEDGSQTYAIHCTPKSQVKGRMNIEGTCYLNASTRELQSFDGVVNDVWLDFQRELISTSSPVVMRVHVDYMHDRGFTEIKNICTHIESGDFHSKTLLYDVEDMKPLLHRLEGVPTHENMLSAIEEAKFDTSLWQYTNVVQRTKEEVRLAGMDGLPLAPDSLVAPPDKLTRLVERLSAFGRTIPQEKVYLHLDNTSYHLGDTIWYAAYLRTTHDGAPSKASRVLYVELFNEEGYLVKRQLVEMKNGLGHGNITLPDDAFGGYYEIRAYTRWQLNWGVCEHPHPSSRSSWFINEEMERHYYRDYEKLYSRVIPVYDKAEEGHFPLTMTRRPLRRTYKEKSLHQLQLSLYPEGGDLVVGLPSRVAFEAVYEDGQYAEGHIGESPTEHRGRGVFTFTPTNGEQQLVTFVSSTGERVTARLPEPVLQGATLSVTREDSVWVAQFHVTKGLSPDSLGLTIMHEGRLQYFCKLTDWEGNIQIETSILPEGVNQATIFDTDGRVWADRLFFVTHGHAGATLEVDGMEEHPAPYTKSTWTIKSPYPNASLSVAVCDASHSVSTSDDGTLLTEMLLSSEVRGFIPNVKWYFESHDTQHQRALDLLMMTQGWRRFRWRNMAVRGTWDLTQSCERSIVLQGVVYDYPESVYNDTDNAPYTETSMPHDLTAQTDRNLELAKGEDYVSQLPIDKWNTEKSKYFKETPLIDPDHFEKIERLEHPTWFEDSRPIARHPKNEVRVHIETSLPQGLDLIEAEKTTHKSKFTFTLPPFYGQRIVHLSASDTTKWTSQRHTWVQPLPVRELQFRSLKDDEEPEFAVRVLAPHPRFVKPYHPLQTKVSYPKEKLSLPAQLGETNILPEVMIQRRHRGLSAVVDSIPAWTVDGMEAQNATMDAGFRHLSIKDIVHCYLGDYGLESPYRQRYRYTGKDLDDGTWERSDEIAVRKEQENSTRLPATVQHYRFYTDYEPRREGDQRYQADLPVTLVDPEPYPGEQHRQAYRDRYYIVQGFSYPDEYYHRDYSKWKSTSAPTDYRRTLYWNPHLVLDAQGKAVVTFWNNGTSERYSISINCMDNEGHVTSFSQ